VPVFEPRAVGGGEGVRMSRVEPDQRAFRTTYDPGHPAADPQGYVKLPNVDSLIEALDMKEAQRAYEANLNVIETARAMEMRTLDLLKK
jgi:flagellar basal-body rod protein FlgC